MADGSSTRTRSGPRATSDMSREMHAHTGQTGRQSGRLRDMSVLRRAWRWAAGPAECWRCRLSGVGHDGFHGGQAGPRPQRRASLEVRLVVTALCLLAAGTAVITGACWLMARGDLQGQADQQLRAYAARL